jgi:acetyl esterase/lipase
VIHSELIYARRYGFRPLAFDLHVPDGSDRPPLVVWIHGGGFHEGDRRSGPKTIRPRSFPTALSEAGMACATIDYRLSGEAKWPAQREDVDTAIGFLSLRGEEYGVDANRLGVAGDSAGGHLALMAAVTSPRVSAAVAWYPVTDIAALDSELGGLAYSPWLGGVPSQMPDVMREASPITYVNGASPPCMLVHGELDSVYPASQSEFMHQRLTRAGVESVCRIIPAVGHGLAECSREAAAALLDDSVAFLRDRI